MAEEHDASPIKAAAEAIKAALEVLRAEADPGSENAPRAGPLVVIGRFYLSMTLILATVTTLAGIVDWKMHDFKPSWVVQTLRLLVVVVVLSGLILGVSLLHWLVKKHPLFLFNPSELTPEQHRLLEEEEAPQPRPNKTSAPPVPKRPV